MTNHDQLATEPFDKLSKLQVAGEIKLKLEQVNLLEGKINYILKNVYCDVKFILYSYISNFIYIVYITAQLILIFI